MKWLFFAIAIIVVLYVLRNSMVHHVHKIFYKPSSYAQRTNHTVVPEYHMGPIQGHESKYQVNQWLSYNV